MDIDVVRNINLIEALTEQNPSSSLPPEDAAHLWSEVQIRQHFAGVLATWYRSELVPHLKIEHPQWQCPLRVRAWRTTVPSTTTYAAIKRVGAEHRHALSRPCLETPT